jgi:lipoprotein NlpI
MNRHHRGSLLITVLLAGVVASQYGTAAEDQGTAAELLVAGRKASAQGRVAQAIEMFTRALADDGSLAEAYYWRGREHFRAGQIEKSLADFDKYVALKPEVEPRQWERGISCYYAGQFERGAKQFELYQTFHDNDVENSTWRYLCMARSVGVEKAREAMLPIRNDRRIPMMAIYDLYRGKLKPEDVLAAANAGDAPEEVRSPQLFYAHLYVGLYYDAAGDAGQALRHIGLAADKYRIDHYMGDVAAVHAARLRAAKDNR